VIGVPEAWHELISTIPSLRWARESDIALLTFPMTSARLPTAHCLRHLLLS
jgi:hypothetical protein